MDILQYLSNSFDKKIVESHSETYRGWRITVQISGQSSKVNGQIESRDYVPLIVVTEQLSIGFKELEVTSQGGYSSPEHCVRAGITFARKFVDDRI